MSAQTHTANKILALIQQDRLSPGAHLSAQKLADRLRLSRSPVNDALVLLERHGIVARQPNRGYFVKPMSADQVDEIYALRLSIEPRAAAEAAQQADEAGRRALIEALDRLESAAADDLIQVANGHREFHTALVRRSDRLLTVQLVERLAILSERYLIAHLRSARNELRARREHRQLLDAWLAGDGAQVEMLLAAHIQTTLEDLERQFASAAA